MDDPSKYSALIPVNIVDGVESYIVLDKPIYREGAEARLIILFKNYSSDSKKIKYYVMRDDKEKLVEAEIDLGGGEYRKEEHMVDITKTGGFHRLKLYVDGKTRDEIKYIVEDPAKRKPYYLGFVWHHHQAPNYLPDGRIHSPWAYTYVWDKHLEPYGLGPYHYHAKILSIHGSFKSTYNLSPSLLRQWEMIITEGVEFIDGRKYGPDSEEAKRVRETLEMYRKALSNGQIDVLTCIYAHTIAGFLTDVLNMHDIVSEEIRYGIEITKRVMGGDYEPWGIWTPEMAFSMSLVSIYYDHGIKYTVLDDQHHFHWAEGDKDSQYEPYILVDTATKKNIVVFFRDHVLSDVLGFKNNFYSEPHAWRNSYETAYLLAEKWSDTRVKTLVLALDGENWMVFPKNKALTAYYLKHLVIYLEAMQDLGFIKISTLREMYNEVPSKRVLTKIPTNTWLGTFRKWRGEIGEHEEYWYRIADAYRRLRAYESLIQVEPGGDDISKRIRWALWHALDSDYWWAEFWKPDIIDAWLGEADKLLNDVLSRVSIRELRVRNTYFEDTPGELLVVVENKLDREAFVRILISGPNTMILRDEIKPLKIHPYSTHSRSIPFKPGLAGRLDLTASIISNNYVVDYKNIMINVKPRLPPNPI